MDRALSDNIIQLIPEAGIRGIKLLVYPINKDKYIRLGFSIWNILLGVICRDISYTRNSYLFCPFCKQDSQHSKEPVDTFCICSGNNGPFLWKVRHVSIG